jgi:hypothetical protein
MPEFYFDIKARVNTEGDSFSKWGWPPVWSGKIEANDSKDARKKIEDEYDRKFILKDGKNTKEEMFLLSIKPMSDYLAKRFEPIQCEMCQEVYTANEAYISGLTDARFCSVGCKKEFQANLELQRLSENVNFANYKNPHVIYMIRNIKEDKVYIGKSIRSFTLRWWEHIKIAKAYSNATNKFHLALQNSSLTDWEFKIIEIVVYPEGVKIYSEMHKYILERETHWINKMDSINNGYNSVESLTSEVPESQINMSF